jgi:chemotaxis signal transduction protein
MNANDPHQAAGTATLSELSASDRHCVFRCGSSWFSVPATSVREISIAPELVRVPGSHDSLEGLGHLRSEFIPVISLGSLLDIERCETSDDHDRLLVFSGNSPWSLLIDEAAALESLETIVTPEVRSDDAQLTAVIGTAMFRDQIVRVLNPNSLYRLAQQALEELWAEAPIRQPLREQGSQP